MQTAEIEGQQSYLLGFH